MKVLAILGSPRRGGNAEILLDRAVDGAKSKGHQVEKVVLSELKFSPCIECGGCDKTGICVIKDDMQGIYQKIDQVEGVILASPIFFGSLPAQVKAMIDRYQCRWIGKHVLNQKFKHSGRKACLILVGGTNRESFFKNAESIAKNFFAVIDAEYKGKLWCPSVDGKAKILEHADHLKQATELGQSFL